MVLFLDHDSPVHYDDLIIFEKIYLKILKIYVIFRIIIFGIGLFAFFRDKDPYTNVMVIDGDGIITITSPGNLLFLSPKSDT